MLNRAFSNVLKKENATLALIMLKKWLGDVTHVERVDLTLSQICWIRQFKSAGSPNKLIGPRYMWRHWPERHQKRPLRFTARFQAELMILSRLIFGNLVSDTPIFRNIHHWELKVSLIWNLVIYLGYRSLKYSVLWVSSHSFWNRSAELVCITTYVCIMFISKLDSVWQIFKVKPCT